MILREIVQALERIERRQEEIIRLLGERGGKAAGERETHGDNDAGALLQAGIDNIMNYQVGKKRGDEQ